MNEQQNIWKSFQGKLNKNHLLIFLLVGILLLVIAIPTEESQIKSEENTDLEKRLESILEGMNGVGDVNVMITLKEDESVAGVAVVAEGGDNAVIVRNITEVVQALFDVDSHKIMVMKGNQTN
ncbi:MAG: hypothetical protein IJ439_06895 [Tyzzerella sp.]|nr:hypothetical protein [Tyzzerella sp.]